MNQRLPFLFFCAFLVAACAGGGRNRPDVALYDLGVVSEAPARLAVAGAIALDVRFPVWLDDQTMVYRLEYDDPRRLRAYARARWAASPARLVEQRLQQRLGSGMLPAPCTLRVTLDEFGQNFATPTASVAVLRGTATLQSKGGGAPARRPLLVEVPAAADAAGGAAALAAATDRLAEILGQWLHETDTVVCRRAA